MVILGLPEEQTLARVVWSSATTMHGALCVMMAGAVLMLKWSVVNLGFHDLVQFLNCIPVLFLLSKHLGVVHTTWFVW